jgi:hypothetical protein
MRRQTEEAKQLLYVSGLEEMQQSEGIGIV